METKIEARNKKYLYWILYGVVLAATVVPGAFQMAEDIRVLECLYVC